MLENGVFKNLFAVIEINLSNNMIESLEEKTFIDCISLRKLNLKSNMLYYLDSRLFIMTENLQYLYLDSNRLNTYESFLLNNKALQILSMMDNPIQNYDANFIKAFNKQRLHSFYYTEQFCKIFEITVPAQTATTITAQTATTVVSHILIENIACEKTTAMKRTSINWSLTKESNGFKNI